MHQNKEHIEAIPHAPGISGADVFRYLPLLMKILEAFGTGSGTFSTNTPVGKRWVRVQDHQFEDIP